MGLGYPLDTMGLAVCQRSCHMHGFQITLQGEAGYLVAVINDGDHRHTNAILLKPTKHCHSLSELLYRVIKKPSSRKADGYLLQCLDSAQV